MTYQFMSETLEAQKESVVLACFEGDNEIAIIENDVNPSTRYAFVVMTQDQEGDTCICEEFFARHHDALKYLAHFLEVEYAGA